MHAVIGQLPCLYQDMQYANKNTVVTLQHISQSYFIKEIKNRRPMFI